MKDSDYINKIIKIQSYVRGIEMRDKIKLKSRPKKLGKLEEKKEPNTEFSYDNKITMKLKENDLESNRFNEIIVNQIN